MEFLALTLDDVQDNTPVDIWPENLTAFQVFQRLGTSWFIGPGGPVGLRYEVLPTVFESLGLRKKHRREVFPDLQIMEQEALNQMAT